MPRQIRNTRPEVEDVIVRAAHAVADRRLEAAGETISKINREFDRGTDPDGNDLVTFTLVVGGREMLRRVAGIHQYGERDVRFVWSIWTAPTQALFDELWAEILTLTLAEGVGLPSIDRTPEEVVSSIRPPTPLEDRRAREAELRGLIRAELSDRIQKLMRDGIDVDEDGEGFAMRMRLDHGAVVPLRVGHEDEYAEATYLGSKGTGPEFLILLDDGTFQEISLMGHGASASTTTLASCIATDPVRWAVMATERAMGMRREAA